MHLQSNSNSFEQKYNDQNIHKERPQPFSEYLSSQVATLRIGDSKTIHLSRGKYKITRKSENIVHQKNLLTGKNRRLQLKITPDNTQKQHVILRHCCILSICIEEYHDNNKIGESGDIVGMNRVGCGTDVQHILNTFDINGWRYKIIRNTLKFEKKVTQREFNRLIKEAQDALRFEGEKYDAFFFIFSGHGTESSICLSPDSAPLNTKNNLRYPEIKISSILHQFKNAVVGKFAGKPKIFMISACNLADNILIENIETDMMVLNVAGEARRDTENGSYLIQAMKQVFKHKNSCHVPLHRLMKYIKSNVSEMSNKTMRCNLQNTCCSMIYFPPRMFKQRTVSDPCISENQTVRMYWTYPCKIDNKNYIAQKDVKDVKLKFSKKIDFYEMKDKGWEIIYSLKKTDVASVGKIFYDKKEWSKGKKVRGFDIKSVSKATISIYDMNSTLARERHKQVTKFTYKK